MAPLREVDVLFNIQRVKLTSSEAPSGVHERMLRLWRTNGRQWQEAQLSFAKRILYGSDANALKLDEGSMTVLVQCVGDLR